MNNDLLSVAKYIDTAAADGRLYHFNGVFAWVRMNEADQAMVVIELPTSGHTVRFEVITDASDYIKDNKSAASHYKGVFAKSPLVEFFSEIVAA